MNNTSKMIPEITVPFKSLKTWILGLRDVKLAGVSVGSADYVRGGLILVLKPNAPSRIYQYNGAFFKNRKVLIKALTTALEKG